eukprot:294979-Chlamydomonas_euryale.AAC.2
MEGERSGSQGSPPLHRPWRLLAVSGVSSDLGKKHQAGRRAAKPHGAPPLHRAAKAPCSIATCWQP